MPSPRKNEGRVATCEGLRGLLVWSLKAVTRTALSILLQLIGNTFDVAGEFHVALSLDRLSLCSTACLDGTFLIGHLRTAGGGEFLLGHARDEIE